VKNPKANTAQRIAFFFGGNRACRKTGIGRKIIIRSDDMLKEAFMIKWFFSIEH
jgi:hypothetical protein